MLTDQGDLVWRIKTHKSLPEVGVSRGKYLKNPMMSVLDIHTRQLTVLKLHYFLMASMLCSVRALGLCSR